MIWAIRFEQPPALTTTGGGVEPRIGTAGRFDGLLPLPGIPQAPIRRSSARYQDKPRSPAAAEALHSSPAEITRNIRRRQILAEKVYDQSRA